MKLFTCSQCMTTYEISKKNTYDSKTIEENNRTFFCQECHGEFTFEQITTMNNILCCPYCLERDEKIKPLESEQYYYEQSTP